MLSAGTVNRLDMSTVNHNEANPFDKAFSATVGSWPELKRASSVPLSFKCMPAKPTFKIELPSFDASAAGSHAVGTVSLPEATLSYQRKSSESETFNYRVLDTPRPTNNHHAPSSGSIPPLTPPDEASIKHWNLVQCAATGGMSTTERTVAHEISAKDEEDSKSNNIRHDPSSASANTPAKLGDNLIVSATSKVDEGSSTSRSLDIRGANNRNDDPGRIVPLTGSNGNNGGEGSPWVERVIDIAVSDSQAASGTSKTIKVLSHALPCPAPEEPGNTPITALSTLISALQTMLQSSPSPFISITHAVPRRFPLTNLPTSPPGTPNVAVGRDQEDYFSMNVFSSAVPLTDRYETTNKVVSEFSAPPSPCLAVPPASVDVALLERFIPPSTVQEYLDLFTHTGPSVLVDRLIELSNENGTLIFIYPTRAGAKTFNSKYLGPILDPILRTMVVIHSLSADVGISLGSMAVADHLQEFEIMKRKLTFLLRKLNRGSGQVSPAAYSLMYSSKEVVHVDRKVWADWYAQQETPRIRDVMTRYFQRAQRLPEQQGINSAVLVREIIDGISKRKYIEGQEPGEKDGMEVGVFVIRRQA